ncbi:hypothetical protein LY76DRAFT_37699 [Colletotrichum caudatum]|nr:hypothetical protein LY76DRAFT_37699 [Colletotrichum caudatum]
MAPATNPAKEKGRANETLPMGEAVFCRPPPPLLPDSAGSAPVGSGSTATRDVCVTTTTSPLEAVDVKVDLTSLKEVVRGGTRVMVDDSRVSVVNQLAICIKRLVTE